MSISNRLKRLIRNLRLGKGRHVAREPRTFTTPAQIQAFCDAKFDRWQYQHGTAAELWIAEPGMTTIPVGYLNLTCTPVYIDRRQNVRYRAGQ